MPSFLLQELSVNQITILHPLILNPVIVLVQDKVFDSMLGIVIFTLSSNRNGISCAY